MCWRWLGGSLELSCCCEGGFEILALVILRITSVVFVGVGVGPVYIIVRLIIYALGGDLAMSSTMKALLSTTLGFSCGDIQFLFNMILWTDRSSESR